MDQSLEILANHKYFVTGVISLIELVLSKSNEMETKGFTEKDRLSHERLRTTCKTVLEGYKYGIENENTKEDVAVDQGKIIKKVYNVLKNCITELKEKNLALLTKRNSEGRIITIIPGVDLGLIIASLTETDTSQLWQYLYMMYISSCKMILMINKHKQKGEVWDAVCLFERELAGTGILVAGKAFNPYIGVGGGSDTADFSVDTMFDGVDKIKPVDPNSGMLEMIGIDKMIDIDKLSDQLKNISQEDIDIATKNIADLLGASNDSDVKDVCSTLVQNIVKDLKENGLSNMFTTAESVTQKLGNQIDISKMKKTASMVGNFMKNSDDKLKNLKDDKGNPIGPNILKQLSMPLQLAKMMGAGNMGTQSEKSPKKKGKK